MLVIGHRGAAGSAPENTIEAFRFGQSAGADMLEFDVQVTRDGTAVVIHDSTLLRTHRKLNMVRFSSHKSLMEAASKGHRIATLDEVLEEFFGKVFLNLELKGAGSARATYELLANKYIKAEDDWQNILIASFKVGELKAMRRYSRSVELSLLHYRNPFLYIAQLRKLRLAAVGFHRLYLSDLALQIAQKAGLFTYVYTVNRSEAAKRFEVKGIDAVVTDFPDVLSEHLSK
jgi:glycerophosphoryl diester phosphodiesterase